MDKLTHIACSVVRILGIVMVGYLFLQGLFTICCIRRVTEVTYFMRSGVIRQLVGIGLFSGLVWWAQSTRGERFWQKYGRYMVWFVGICVFGCFSVWILVTRFWYFGDMEKIFQYAGMVLEGDFSGWLPGGYPYEWTQQNTLILFVALLLKLFGREQSFLAFYFVNLFCYGVTLFALFRILYRLEGGDSVACRIQKLMLLLYFPYGFLIMMLSGDMIGFAWACLAMAFLNAYLENRRLWQLVLSCLCCILAVNFRQNEMIVFIGILILLGLDCLHAVQIPDAGRGAARRQDRPMYRILLWLCYLVIALAGFRVPDAVVSGMSGMAASGGNSRLAHVAMGLSESDKAPGWYNNYVDEVFAANGYDTAATAAASKEKIAERLAVFGEDPAYAWQFFHKKLASEWNNPTFECFHNQNWRLTGVELPALIRSAINDGGKLNLVLIEWLDIAQSVVLFGVLMYLVCVKATDLRKLFFMILFIGGFLFFLFWEAKSRYVVSFYLLLLPYAYPGYAALLKQKRVKPVLVVGILIAVIGISGNSWINNAFKPGQDTEAYYEYIHEYDHNFEWFRF